MQFQFFKCKEKIGKIYLPRFAKSYLQDFLASVSFEDIVRYLTILFSYDALISVQKKP